MPGTELAWLGLKLLLLLAAANTAPLQAKTWLGARWAAPIDFGLVLPDGRPLLGRSKTWRGLAAAVLATTLAAPLLGLPVAIGAVVGLGAMAGDALASFTKRRLGTPPSGRATGIDQIPEALLPLLLVREPLGLPWWLVIALPLVFFALEIPLAKLWHRLGWRDKPY
jgi:CDP-diglyceride synthetase